MSSRPRSAFVLYGRLGKFTWRMLATVLAGQALAIFFGALVARALASADGRAGAPTLLWLGSGLAVLSILAAGLMRRPYGVTLGWLVQVATWVSAVVLPMMVGVGLIFTALWFVCLVQGHRIDSQTARADV